MEWLQNLLAGESGMAVQLVLISLALVVLLILVFWLFRKITGAAAPKSSRNRVPRLSVTDSTRVDENRYLVLVRRDNVEHLVMIGGPSDVVVETNIVRTQAGLQPVPAKTPAAPQPKPAAEAANRTSADADKPAAIATGVAATGVAAAAVGATAGVSAKDTEAETRAPEPAKADAESAETEPQETVEISEPVEEPVVAETPREADPLVEELDISFDGLEDEITIAAEDSSKQEPVQVEQDEIDVTLHSEPAADLPESDLEASISEQLDDVLSSETIELDASESTAEGTPEPQETAEIELDESDKQESAENKDDMQRLLDELAGVKETA